MTVTAGHALIVFVGKDDERVGGFQLGTLRGLYCLPMTIAPWILAKRRSAMREQPVTVWLAFRGEGAGQLRFSRA
jgi:hypothetical protein